MNTFRKLKKRYERSALVDSAIGWNISSNTEPCIMQTKGGL
ncbi:hypothetical protein N481_16390 [Pseudoalteromonas luteoviolacea S4047-1]|uniref:Uncharacterized protein n=1 Tax=Pseudoalteromonas luteoviolacea S4054 TaxID=1129367 RepID=A0A0F6AIC6_9GAMM|nr:hypothetical protein N479_25640 [Pseudoalteromonas luteoviolacea S4054]KZN71989.1 hypothetical protein N481_16390 [Pseudoalteromonas luteoviolacea S4047-1]